MHALTALTDVMEMEYGAPPVCADDGLSAFLYARPRLFGIAYRMLGSAAEAEDIVQDVWVRWQTTDRSPVRNPLAFLVTATTRLAINVVRSARARRETCAGESLPEPIDTSADPGVSVERREALNLAMQLLFEKLAPTERAAYVLREALNYSYREIADSLGIGEANARQVVTRARQRVSGDRRASAIGAQAPHRRTPGSRLPDVNAATRSPFARLASAGRSAHR
jgi:RNA polymerase sigma-70 factor, ECF subfamily